MDLALGEDLQAAPGRLQTLARVDNLANRDHVGSVIVNDGNRRFFEPGAPRSLLLRTRAELDLLDDASIVAATRCLLSGVDSSARRQLSMIASQEASSSAR